VPARGGTSIAGCSIGATANGRTGEDGARLYLLEFQPLTASQN
jgi:hypothetical protein